MTPREELEALRRLDELQARKGSAPKPPPKPDAFDEQIKADLKESGGYLENLGAGANSVWQGVKQLTGNGTESDDQIRERRKRDEELGKGRFGGGVTQMVGEQLALAPLTLATGGAGAVASKLPMVAKVAGAGGKIANVGNVVRGAVEGATQAAANSTTSDESRAMNTIVGGGMGAALPLALAGGTKVIRELAPWGGNPAFRAERALNKELKDAGGVEAINMALAHPNTQSRLPLTVSARTENPTLARLERGARNRGTGSEDLAYNADKGVAEGAWDWLRGATKTADELPQRLNERELAIAAQRSGAAKAKLGTQSFEKSQTMASDAINAAREHASGRILADPLVSKELANVQTLITQPNATGHYFETAADRIKQLHQGDVDPVQRGILQDLEQQIRDAGDRVTRNSTSGTKMVQMMETDAVKEAEAAKAIRETFKSPEGVVKTPKQFGDVPVVSAPQLNQALAKHGEEVVGADSRKILNQADFDELQALSAELRKSGLYKDSPGASSVKEGNPSQIVFSGVNNPLNQAMGLKGAVNWLTGGSIDKTHQALDRSLMSPEAWDQLQTLAAKYKTTPEDVYTGLLPKLEQMKIDALRYGARAPGNAAAAQGD